MSDYVTGFQTKNGIKKYDYNSLANLPSTPSARISYITLLAREWVGDASPYSQRVIIEKATEKTQVDLTPDVGQLVTFHQKDLAFVTENVDGVITVYAIGDKPMNDYTIQVTLTEVTI